MQAASNHERACGEISRLLATMAEPTGGQIRSEIRRICAKYSLERMPGNREILAAARGADIEDLQGMLVKKPVKTASGVAVIALMPRPYACPHGRCTYCPGGIESNTPNSYTGMEPATLNAIENSYDPRMQILTKVDRLVACGHDPSKLELVIVGGTFLFMPRQYQRNFVKSCYDALNGTKSASLEEAKGRNAGAAIRNVGLTIETKPDYCRRGHVDAMLEYGATRVEIGVQSLQERVYRRVNRGHTYADVVEAFQIARDAGYKIVAHMMPGLPTVTPEEDMADFGRLFADSDLKPDMLKIYPALVLKGTPLYDEYVAGEYRPYSEEEMIRVLAEAKGAVPPWVRIMRIQREISPDEIIAGPRSGNLRQRVSLAMRSRGLSCSCIRCREVGLSGGGSVDSLNLRRIRYGAAGGDEEFLSYEDGGGRLYGFLRLRRPGPRAHRSEVAGRACIVRELHVYGRSLGLGRRDGSEVQHSGLGRSLMQEAERVSMEEYDATKLLVISAVGTRPYYRRLGYEQDGPYMARELAA